jgi:aspartyl-tRNA(Asn)/glutamyl-tRNA(Gln) amidotransferase subunit A
MPKPTSRRGGRKDTGFLKKPGEVSPDTIASASARLARGMTTASDLVEASLAAIALHGPRTNAFVTVDAEGARRAGRALDRERANGVDRGPLHGIPISLKDLIDEAGVVTTAGSSVLKDRVAADDATVVRRLRDAGAIIIGRTNLHEFALGTTSDSSAFGPVRHPMDLTRSAGGSSGGSAAAVATGMGLASIGSDTGGSVRIPAAACGLVGLKPSYGDVPLEGVVPLSPSLDHVGPLARTVQDALWLYGVLAGLTPRTIARPDPPDIRLGRLGEYFNGPLDPVVRHSFEGALEVLASAGVRLDDRRVEGTGRITETYPHIVLAEAAWWHAPYLDARADDYTPSVHSRIGLGRRVTAVQYLEAQAFRAVLRAAVDAALDGVDALVLPTLPLVAPPLGAETITLGPDGESVTVRAAMLRHTQPFNMTGHPAVTLPLPSPGLPVGLQLVGRTGMTAVLANVAAACETILSR